MTADFLGLIEYRLRAVSIGHLALSYSMEWEAAPDMKVYFNDLQVMEGRATGFTNGAIESAIVHCRALLEFIGLGAGRTTTTLRELTEVRRTDDLGIEQVPGLSRVSIAEAVPTYPGSAAEAEASLGYVIYLANKGLAHTTRSFGRHDEGARHLVIAFSLVPVLVANKVFGRLGIKPPSYEVAGRPRPK